MDEDDEEWLEEYNATAPTTAAAVIENGKPLDPVPNGTTTPGRSGRDRKGKGEKGKGVTGAAGVVAEEKKAEAGVGPIGEDDFELIMEVFERVTEEKAPMAHVVRLLALALQVGLLTWAWQDVELLPTMTDFEPTFADRTVKPPLEHLRFFARAVYPHWKARRLKRGGKSILPQLDVSYSPSSFSYTRTEPLRPHSTTSPTNRTPTSASAVASSRPLARRAARTNKTSTASCAYGTTSLLRTPSCSRRATANA